MAIKMTRERLHYEHGAVQSLGGRGFKNKAVLRNEAR